jgi:hypothetical protein
MLGFRVQGLRLSGLQDIGDGDVNRRDVQLGLPGKGRCQLPAQGGGAVLQRMPVHDGEVDAHGDGRPGPGDVPGQAAFSGGGAGKRIRHGADQRRN